MRKDESGFSLVELMIGAIVLLISAGAIVAVLQVSVSLHSKTEQGLELQENVRSALSYICRDLINAGSGVPYLTKINGSPAIVVPSGARLGPLGASVDAGYVFFVTPCHGTGETVTADGEGNALPEPIQTDMLVFLGGMGDARFVQENSPGPSANWGAIVYLEDNSIFKLGQVILISNGFQVSLGQVTQVLPDGGLQFNNGGKDVLGLNSPADAGTPNPNYYAAQQIPGGPPPQVFPLASITYYLDATTNPAHPMIKRLANSADGAGAGTPLADDIENLKVTFLVDDDANATTPAIAIDSPTTGQLSLVRGITVSITGRSHAKMGNTAYPDGHGRLTMSETVFFRNNIRR
jgi:hypothetical protein